MKFRTNEKPQNLSTPLGFYQIKFTNASSLKHESYTFKKKFIWILKFRKKKLFESITNLSRNEQWANNTFLSCISCDFYFIVSRKSLLMNINK